MFRRRTVGAGIKSRSAYLKQKDLKVCRFQKKNPAGADLYMKYAFGMKKEKKDYEKVISIDFKRINGSIGACRMLKQHRRDNGSSY